MYARTNSDTVCLLWPSPMKFSNKTRFLLGFTKRRASTLRGWRRAQSRVWLITSRFQLTDLSCSFHRACYLPIFPQLKTRLLGGFLKCSTSLIHIRYGWGTVQSQKKGYCLSLREVRSASVSGIILKVIQLDFTYVFANLKLYIQTYIFLDF